MIGTLKLVLLRTLGRFSINVNSVLFSSPDSNDCGAGKTHINDSVHVVQSGTRIFYGSTQHDKIRDNTDIGLTRSIGNHSIVYVLECPY